MSINPNQGQNPEQPDPYGAYRGYAPIPPSAQPADPDDPYNSKWYGQQPAEGRTGADAGQHGTGQQQMYQQYGTGQQQQQTYQPPKSAYRSSGPSGASTMSMNPRIAALLSNALIWVGGLFFFFAERKNRFVRFNAAQSVLFFGAVSIVFTVISLLGFLTVIPLLGWFFALIFGLVHTVLLIGAGLVWAFLMFQAYRGVKFKLPFFGDYAETLVNRFTK